MQSADPFRLLSIFSIFSCLVGCRFIAGDVLDLATYSGLVSSKSWGDIRLLGPLIKCLQSYTGVVHDSSGLIFRQGGFLCIKPLHLSKHISFHNQQELFVHM